MPTSPQNRELVTHATGKPQVQGASGMRAGAGRVSGQLGGRAASTQSCGVSVAAGGGSEGGAQRHVWGVSFRQRAWAQGGWVEGGGTHLDFGSEPAASCSCQTDCGSLRARAGRSVGRGGGGDLGAARLTPRSPSVMRRERLKLHRVRPSRGEWIPQTPGPTLSSGL